MGCSERLGPFAPPSRPRAGHGFSTYSMPLQGEFPKAGLTSAGSKVPISSSAMYGIVRWLSRTPKSAVIRGLSL